MGILLEFHSKLILPHSRARIKKKKEEKEEEKREGKERKKAKPFYNPSIQGAQFTLKA